MTSDTHYQAFKYRDAELRRAAEQHRMVREAVQGTQARDAADPEAGNSGEVRGGRAGARLRGARRSRRAASPSGC
jgi:hypothetical protein